MEITFRCLPKFEATLPRPVPAANRLPDWLRSMPATAFSELQKKEIHTAKQCAPFIDAMTAGFLIPLAVDIKVENSKLTWDRNDLGGKPPVNQHEQVQVDGTPFSRVPVIRFNNFWTIETPPGYSLLVVHPINLHALPFITITGLVDTDKYVDNFINFPVHWCDVAFKGVLPKGTPIAQCIPIKRDDWTSCFGTIEGDAANRLIEVSQAVADEPGTYRRQFRAPKHWR